MQLRAQSICWCVVALLAGVSSLRADSINRKDFYHPADGMPGEERYTNRIRIGDGVAANVAIDVTAKGNGYMSILNLRLKVFDDHDDGAVYENGLLHIDFQDIDDDGFMDLIVSGLVIYTGEQKNSPKSHEPVVFIYRFDPHGNVFKLVYRRASFDLSVGPAVGAMAP